MLRGQDRRAVTIPVADSLEQLVVLARRCPKRPSIRLMNTYQMRTERL
jgi:hypothetical protein